MKAGLFGIAMAVACAHGASAQSAPADAARFDAIVAKHSSANGVPERLVRRVIMRESRYNPRAYNRGHYGMMQIKHATAKSMGYQGDASGLFDADTNLAYAVRYLAGAYKVAGGDEDKAVRFYASGYYYDAKRKGMLAAIGLGRNGKFGPPPAQVAAATPPATAPAPAARVETRIASTTPAAPPAPRVIGADARPVLASVAPVAPAAVPVPPVAATRPAATTSPAANARVAGAADAIGGLSRVAAVQPASPVREAQAYAGSRALGAPAELVDMATPARAGAVAVPLPPTAPRQTAAATPVAVPATAAVRATAATQTAAVVAPLPPEREPQIVTGAIEPAAVAPRAKPRRFGPPK
ncbi:transglycosylase SLT domain-containing protein [Methylopila henanensis]|uniref:Transglycosylase SLT domain-containing protein n=1 Tax=Methylopila henanensis TaxID=873516 RepID=A0ABW4K7S7_9HYPH